MNFGYTRIPIESLITLAKLYNVDMNYSTVGSTINKTNTIVIDLFLQLLLIIIHH